MDYPRSYSEAARSGESKYFTGKPCKFGHIATRRTSNQVCIDCERLKSAAWKLANEEKRKASNSASKKRAYNKLSEAERVAAVQYRKDWRSKNRQAVRAYSKKWRDANLEQARAAELEWAKSNPGKKSAKDAKRRAIELTAAPPCLTDEDWREIERIYSRSREMSVSEGSPYHVDHIVPLRGRDVCGLHVPWNLQIIPADENRRKLNKVSI